MKRADLTLHAAAGETADDPRVIAVRPAAPSGADGGLPSGASAIAPGDGVLPAPTHPNHARWQRAAERAVLRGALVCDLLAGELALEGARVLDAGCGGGGTSIALTMRGARVTATDRRADRLVELRANHPGITADKADLHALPFSGERFDGVVLQDVIEHVADPAAVLREIARVLRPGGALYLSTPNRDALPNLVADPHFGLPLVSRKDRAALRRVLRRWRPADAERDDLAQLLPETRLLRLLSEAGFTARFVNRAVAQRLFREPEAVVWSDLHLSSVRWMRRTGAHHILLSLVRDRAGLLNRLLNPTFYLICRKEDA